MNEWAFAAEVKKWWDAEFRNNRSWGLDRCEVEKGGEATKDRSDLAILGGGLVRMRGELRLPDHPVADPWHPDNLRDAIQKAERPPGSRWAFTSDATRLLLIDTDRRGLLSNRVVMEIPLVTFHARRMLDSETFLAEAEKAWVRAIQVVVPIVLGLSGPPGMSPDEAFINSLHALLSDPVAAIRHELNQRRVSDPSFAQKLVQWMVDDQGWTHADENWEEEVLRAARLTAYVFTMRLMFYEALRRSKPLLKPLSLGDVGASIARAIFSAFFEDAKKKSGDYNTLFNWDEACEFALIADASVPGWRSVVEHLAAFNVTTIGYDVLGKMFERLIEPNERYRWGQHYTNPDVVDLMLSFAMEDGVGGILDPAVGGGTFLVRAYVRKRVLHPEKSHQDILKELFGLDVSAFAATLATVNLAIRNLDFADNYPQVAARSFFQVQPQHPFMSLPIPQSVSLDDGQSSAELPVTINAVRAVVSNPPYIRLHELGVHRQNEAERALAAGNNPLSPTRLHGASNYHLYFWFHGAQFLEPGGKLVLLTSGEWMDSDYGVALQDWLLKHFAIECFIESISEPWFSEARVGTVVTIARRCAIDDERNQNDVRFVQLRKPLRDLYGPSSSETEHLANVDKLKERLLQLKGRTGESDDLDWSVVKQSDLRELGTTTTTKNGGSNG